MKKFEPQKEWNTVRYCFASMRRVQILCHSYQLKFPYIRQNKCSRFSLPLSFAVYCNILADFFFRLSAIERNGTDCKIIAFFSDVCFCGKKIAQNIQNRTSSFRMCTCACVQLSEQLLIRLRGVSRWVFEGFCSISLQFHPDFFLSFFTIFPLFARFVFLLLLFRWDHIEDQYAKAFQSDPVTRSRFFSNSSPPSLPPSPHLSLSLLLFSHIT